ncbi:hypothetical protein GCM10020358_07110 [Amorphoplanes nipponensis]|uniref:Uncharacterized protein n=1 Tax=Actinoplanes nipponensis TaxID=135950 RepID=A0A919JCF0_9ACTN|nr:hypothetical protein [Actinoplanes nipponensis]GIE47258.1 hypothetical protein Ani05nite_07920 [Actinoplanes nipponensis]
MRTLRRPVLSAAVTVGALALAGATGTAFAAPRVPPGQAFTTSATDATYPLPAEGAAWSVAATQGRDGGQADLEIRDAAGRSLIRSAEGFGILDWVAVNTNAGRHPAGRYDVRVTADTDGGRPTTHLVQLVGGGADLVPGRPGTVGDTARPWLVDVRDLPLRAGDMVSLRVGGAVGAVAVLGDDPKPIFWLQTRRTADLSTAFPKPDTDDQTFTVDFTAPEDGVYGVVFEARNDYSRAARVDVALVG